MVTTIDTRRLTPPNAADATELAVVALTAVTAASFARVFSGWAWLPMLLTFAVASHAVAVG